MLIIPQTLNINNLRITSAKCINLHTIRKLPEYSLKKFLSKAKFILTRPAGYTERNGKVFLE